MKVDDDASAVEAAPCLHSGHALDVLFTCLVQLVEDFRSRGIDGSTGNISHRLGHVVVRRVEEGQHTSALVNDVNGARLIQMGLGQRLQFTA